MSAGQKIVLLRVNNLIGTFYGIDEVPPDWSSTYIVTADLPHNEQIDATNWLQVNVEADFGNNWQTVARGSAWNGGPTAMAPVTQYVFPRDSETRLPMPPLRVRGVLVNGLRGNGSPAICGLISKFQ